MAGCCRSQGPGQSRVLPRLSVTGPGRGHKDTHGPAHRGALCPDLRQGQRSRPRHNHGLGLEPGLPCVPDAMGMFGRRPSQMPRQRSPVAGEQPHGASFCRNGGRGHAEGSGDHGDRRLQDLPPPLCPPRSHCRFPLRRGPYPGLILNPRGLSKSPLPGPDPRPQVPRLSQVPLLSPFRKWGEQANTAFTDSKPMGACGRGGVLPALQSER